MKKRFILFLLIFASLSTFAVPATIILDKSIPVTSQITKINTLYKVSYDFDLGGATLRVPKGCSLFFDGGSFYNGTIVFSDTELAGLPRIYCNLQGSVPMADITWFGANRGDNCVDVGEIINKVQRIATHIVIPAGEFYQIKEPIRIEGAKVIDWIGTIICASTQKMFDSFTIASGVMTFDMKGRLICQSKSVNYETKTCTSINGLIVENINNSTVIIGTISGFNTGMRVEGYGGGCSYNMFSIRAIRDCNTGVLITQRDKEGKRGWANENTFIGGRFGVSSTWDTKKRETHAVVAKGIYKDDSYNKVNSLYFLRPCAEGNFVPFVFNNAEIVSVVNCRTEKGEVGAILSGRTNRISLSNSIGTSLSNLDLSELDKYQSRPLFDEKDLELRSSSIVSFDKNDSNYGIIAGKEFTPRGNFRHISYKGVAFSTASPIMNGDVSEVGTEIVFEKNQNANGRAIGIELPQNQSNSRRYVYLVVKETFDGKVAGEKDISFGQNMRYNRQNSYWVSSSDINNAQLVVGENVKKVAVVFRNITRATIVLPMGAKIDNTLK